MLQSGLFHSRSQDRTQNFKPLPQLDLSPKDQKQLLIIPFSFGQKCCLGATNLSQKFSCNKQPSLKKGPEQSVFMTNQPTNLSLQAASTSLAEAWPAVRRTTEQSKHYWYPGRTLIAAIFRWRNVAGHPPLQKKEPKTPKPDLVQCQCHYYYKIL